MPVNDFDTNRARFLRELTSIQRTLHTLVEDFFEFLRLINEIRAGLEETINRPRTPPPRNSSPPQ